MKSYKSHKTVKAAKIIGYERELVDIGGHLTPAGAFLTLDDGTRAKVDESWLKKHGGQDHDGPDADHDLVGGYFVEYEDGYASWSPAEAFEKGYTEASLDPKDGALPVSGYKPQTGAKVDMVNDLKADEERLLRKLDRMADMSAMDVDRRWMAIGRTGLEQAFMALNRSIFQPGRVALPDDASPS